jgi:hypothetical protein
MMSHVLKNQEDKAKIRLLEDDDVNFWCYWLHQPSNACSPPRSMLTPSSMELHTHSPGCFSCLLLYFIQCNYNYFHYFCSVNGAFPHLICVCELLSPQLLPLARPQPNFRRLLRSALMLCDGLVVKPAV